VGGKILVTAQSPNSSFPLWAWTWNLGLGLGLVNTRIDKTFYMCKTYKKKRNPNVENKVHLEMK